MSVGEKLKVALVCSSGGHLTQLHLLREWWEEQDRFWVTFDKEDARALLRGERRYWCFYPTNRSVWNLIRNTVIAISICRRERPDVVVSTGAGPAVPFFFVAKLLFGAKTIFLEVVDRVREPTLTGKLVRNVTDLYLVQWPEQATHAPHARVIGRLV